MLKVSAIIFIYSFDNRFRVVTVFWLHSVWEFYFQALFCFFCIFYRCTVSYSRGRACVPLYTILYHGFFATRALKELWFFECFFYYRSEPRGSPNLCTGEPDGLRWILRFEISLPFWKIATTEGFRPSTTTGSIPAKWRQRRWRMCLQSSIWITRWDTEEGRSRSQMS